MTTSANSRSSRRRRAAAALATLAAAGLLGSALPAVGAPAAVPGLKARGNTSSYKFIAKVDGEPVHWDSCAKLGWRINLRRAPSHALRQAREAMSRVKHASDLPFRYQGKTRVHPRRFGKYPRDTDLVLGWGRLTTTAGDVAGIGAPQWDADTGEILKGYVLLNSTIHLRAGFGRGPKVGTLGTEGQLLMHEFGHVVGLDHVKAKSQILYPVLTRKKATWGAGDRHGLHKVGAAAGCFS